MERKLTTILAADVVGYSSLMENDEAGTFDRLRAHRKELFEPEIVKHHGRIFKLMGDGLLVEFGSVVDAVECAVALQRGLAERNANVPDDQRLEVRIGINLGEVIVEGEDRFGEGVNIAARPTEYSGLVFMGEFPFRNYADLERVLQGLRKAGVPELPFGLNSRSKDQLNGAAIKALLFGHQIEGYKVETGEAYSRKTAADGATTIAVGGWSDKGTSQIEGDTICTFYPSQYRLCSAAFRNPNGTFTQRNEYLFVAPGGRFEFSVVR